ncbi:MAG: TMEM165/GDT1 family protein [Kiloniellaceae bacterium]
MSQILAIFATVFLAELGDKTQLATLLFASGREAPPLMVFLAAAAALVLATAVAVMLGVAAERHLAALPLKLIAGAGFVALGLWTIWDHLRAVQIV